MERPQIGLSTNIPYFAKKKKGRLMRSPCCLRVRVSPHNVARQRFGKPVPAATNTKATIAELMDVAFSIWSVLIKYSIYSERKAGVFRCTLTRRMSGRSLEPSNKTVLFLLLQK
jgi:hypothetical protein